MFHLISKSLLHSRNGYAIVTAPNPSVPLSLLLRYFSTDSIQSSFTVSYLVNSCGLTPQSALTASKTVQFENPVKPDMILSFFRNLGFSKPQISTIISRFPALLSYDLQKTIIPKVELFRSTGASSPDLVKIFTTYPWILQSSLENQLVPAFNFLTELFESEKDVIELIKTAPILVRSRPEAFLIPNMNTLRENGVPKENILSMLRYNSRCIMINSAKFRETVEEAKKMGWSLTNSQFLSAIAVLSVGKSIRDRKIDAYKKWGWSNRDIKTSFKKYPWFLAISEDKLTAVMDFFVNQLGLDVLVIVNCPYLLGLSLKKRLIPRGRVIQFLSSKGLVKLDSSVASLFKCTEKLFLDKYVNCHEDFGPHLTKLYFAAMNNNNNVSRVTANVAASLTARTGRSNKCDSID